MQNIIYAIQHIDSGMTKIGITCQWNSRCKSLKVGEKTKLLGLFQSDELAEAEKELHDTFKEWRLPGSEYFNFNKKQIKELLSLMTDKYQSVEKYYNYYNKVKKSQDVEITRALGWSASDWFRLCKSSWFCSIIKTAENDLHAKDCFFEPTDFDIFQKELNEAISHLSEQFRDTYASWFLEWFVAQEIWYELKDNLECWINKKKFKKTSCYNHSYGRYYSKYQLIKPKFEDIIAQFPESIAHERSGCVITKSTLKVIYSIVCEYRFVEYVERACECMDDDFKYYYNQYGPTKKNKLLSGCGDTWINTYGNY